MLFIHAIILCQRETSLGLDMCSLINCGKLIINMLDLSTEYRFQLLLSLCFSIDVDV